MQLFFHRTSLASQARACAAQRRLLEIQASERQRAGRGAILVVSMACFPALIALMIVLADFS